MAYSRSRKNSSFEFLKQNWVYILMGIFVLPYIFRMFLNRKTIIASEEQKAEIKYLEAIKGNENEQDKYMQDETTHQQRLIAKEIYHHLGFAYSWYDPRRWTENDEDIYLLLKGFNPIPKGIATAYFVYSAGRDLKADLIKLLDTKYYKLLKW